MIVTHDIGSLGSELQLTLLASRQGRVVQEGIVWRIHSLSDKTASYESSEAQPCFSVKPGKYSLEAVYQEKKADLGEVELKQNSRVDAAFIMNTDQVGDEYFADIDPSEDFSRRQQERDYQADHGAATLPLRDPSQQIQGEYGSQILAHPLLAKSVQFDGVPPDMRPDPAENEAALQLTLAAQLTNQPDAVSTPSPTPT